MHISPPLMHNPHKRPHLDHLISKRAGAARLERVPVLVQFLSCFLSILGPHFGVQQEPQNVIFRFWDQSFFGSRFARPQGAVSKAIIWIPCGKSDKNQVSPRRQNVSKNGPKWDPKPA